MPKVPEPAPEPEPLPEPEPQDYSPEMVTMHHPDLKDSTTTVTREAFNEVWAEKGWVEGEQAEGSSADQDQGPEAAS